ncbi:MAG: hypothetical protein A3I78_00735 [Gammaproteobacteria bacterium RIFCSPLOWO2_02_FULL_56_15]|nr:MAG: hypothetical protein A3I78_00735 [Gammaproteobacteria bacterium RIFCSPLOWO2_02_FULL_56_15]
MLKYCRSKHAPSVRHLGGSMKHVILLLALALAACASAPSAAQDTPAVVQSYSPEARVEAYLAALSSNDPRAFKI